MKKIQFKLRVTIMALWVGFSIFLLSSLGAFAALRAEAGPGQRLGGARVFTWSKVDEKNEVFEVGVTIPHAVFQNPPMGKGPAGVIAVLPFPEAVRKSSYFNHFELNWEPYGHEPNVFTVPHFDFHFYSIPASEVMKIVPPDSNPPVAQAIPAGFLYPGVDQSVPQMGVHAIRPSDLEKQFSEVLIFGFHAGKMHFIEPMVTRDFLLKKQPIAYDIPMPSVLGAVTRYPTKFSLSYDAATNTHQLVFSDFVSTR